MMESRVRARYGHPLDRVGVDVGVAISTVAGRLTIIFAVGVGWMTSATALQTSTANSSSVPV